MSVAAPARTPIALAAGCTAAGCLEMAGRLKAQLDPSYARGAALLPLDESFEQYRQRRRTARRRAARAQRLGYRFEEIDRADHLDDIYAVNTSAPERQGRPMSDGYNERPSYSSSPLGCPRHHVYPYGVLAGAGPLVAYLWLYRAGELALVSTILGHADHLAGDVMYLLFLGMVEQQYALGGTVFYNLWDSGQDGLRFFKARLGLERGDVEWKL